MSNWITAQAYIFVRARGAWIQHSAGDIMTPCASARVTRLVVEWRNCQRITVIENSHIAGPFNVKNPDLTNSFSTIVKSTMSRTHATNATSHCQQRECQCCGPTIVLGTVEVGQHSEAS